ncbi:hypothetical protein DFQ27_001349 [Actinomortierella ambigua]|uniref:Iron hydrogenase small subunit domain-containing protein n=1 Tax=Actinomortierella ambigua TaxID=1343610 RepID=A0A9P6U8K2_9FUNG|nr:hypothetical protein DFQ27_001349 [Actinomortierella ambigua]
MALSGALQLSDLNDFIAPSQACIKPVESNKTSDVQGTIKVDSSGSYYEVSQDGLETKLETATINLNDCLACSGCITSAESVLITLQSQEELYSILKQNKAAIEANDSTSHRTVVVSISPQTRASFAAKYNLSPLQVARKLTWFFKNLGVHSVFDTTFSRDLALLETAREFVARYRTALAQGKVEITSKEGDNSSSNAGGGDMDVDGSTSSATPATKTRRRIIRRDLGRDGPAAAVAAVETASALPMLASACPGWICYAEKTHGYILPYISETKSPQQIMGSMVKQHFGAQLGLRPDQIYHVCVMPCYDKKLEASRGDFYSDLYKTRDVDCVITSTEVEKMFTEQGLQEDLATFGEMNIDLGYTSVVKDPATGEDQVLLGSSGNASGGFLEYVMQYAAREVYGVDGVDVEQSRGVEVKTVRNSDFREVTLEVQGKVVLRFAAAYGFRNIQNLVRKVKGGKSPYHFVEVMACPSGCINGGGQLKQEASVSLKDWIAQVDAKYREGILARKPEENPVLAQLYQEWLGGLDTEKARQQLSTCYHAVEQNLVNPLAVKW